MLKERRATFEGHKRKFFAVIDHTEECLHAVTYAARRAKKTQGVLVLLYVIVPSEFQHWLGVEKIMRTQAQEEANKITQEFLEKVRFIASDLQVETLIREGNRADELLDVIEEDEDIASLVLASSVEKDSPGPLISNIISKNISKFPVPITVVPGHLSEDDLDAIA